MRNILILTTVFLFLVSHSSSHALSENAARKIFSKHRLAFSVLTRKAEPRRALTHARWVVSKNKVGAYIRLENDLWRKQYGKPASRGPELTLEQALQKEGLSLEEYQACLDLLETAKQKEIKVVFSGSDVNIAIRINEVPITKMLPRTSISFGYLNQQKPTEETSNKETKREKLEGNWYLFIKHHKPEFLAH